MGYTHISVEVKEEITRLLQTGMTGTEIAEKTGVSCATVTKMRKKLQEDGFDIWHRGSKIAESIPCASGIETKPSIPCASGIETKPSITEKRQSLIFERQIVRLIGASSGFRYTVGQRDFEVIIQDPNNGGTFSFDSEEAFSNFVYELIDLTTEIGKERG